ncbi:MAG: hypothetical protein JNK28_12930 [Burkholderiaceae bacterium]|nr:hypothetical protein [Burkholderiaceae bacterium]
MSVTSVRVATRAALGLVMLIGGGAALAQARESPFPKVCDQVIGPVEAANQTSAKRGLIHVYRDALGRMVSLEVADTRAETGPTLRYRVERRTEAANLCWQGYELALFGDAPALASGPVPVAPGREVLAHESVDLSRVAVPTSERARLASATAWALPSLPPEFSVVRLSGIVYGVILSAAYFHTSGFYTIAQRPAGTTTQWLNFGVNMSPSYQATQEHIAVTLFLTPNVGALAIIGNGMVIGSTQAWSTSTPGPDLIGCGGPGSGYPAFNSQIEAFWVGGNAVFDSTCQPQSAPLGQTQFYTLHANMYQDVAYWGPGLTPRAKNTSSVRPTYWDPNGGGVLVFTTTEDRNTQGIDFDIQFTQVQGGWF